MNFGFGHGIAILKMAIFDIVDCIANEPALVPTVKLPSVWAPLTLPVYKSERIDSTTVRLGLE